MNSSYTENATGITRSNAPKCLARCLAHTRSGKGSGNGQWKWDDQMPHCWVKTTKGSPRWHHRKSGSILHRRNAFLRHPGFPLACQCLLRRDYVGVGETQTSTCPPESGRLTTADLFFCTETSFWLGPVSWLYNQKAQFWNSTRNTRRQYRSVCHPYFSFTYRRISALCTLCRRHRGRCQLFREAPRKEHFQALCRRSSNCSELFNLS